MTFAPKFATHFNQLGSLSGTQWLELGTKHGPQLLTGVAVIGIAWQAARLTWLLLTPQAPAQNLPPLPTPPASAAAAVNVQAIADAHLFGLPQAMNADADPNNLPQTQINLVLTGTIALEDPQAGFAIVGESASNARFYRAGATISGLARLHSVYQDRVIIDRGGTLETLILPRAAPSNAVVPRNLPTPASAVVDNIRRLATNPTALGQLMRTQPVFANGSLKGFRVYPGRDRNAFARAGLQPGDLVTAINGTALDDPGRGNEILNTLNSSSTASVSINRNGQDMQLTLDMTQLPTAEGDVPTGTGAEAEAGAAASPPGTPREQRFGGTPPRPIEAQ